MQGTEGYTHFPPINTLFMVTISLPVKALQNVLTFRNKLFTVVSHRWRCRAPFFAHGTHMHVVEVRLFADDSQLYMTMSHNQPIIALTTDFFKVCHEDSGSCY